MSVDEEGKLVSAEGKITGELPVRVEEPQKQPPTKMTDFSEQIEKLLPSVGTIELSESEKEVLYASVDEKVVEIRPDGLIYLPWMQYVTRLRNALGIAWGLIPVGFPKTKGEMVLWPHWFIIRGVPVSFVIGEQLWDPNNKRMSWSEACEGARSNALMRACKSIGITLELWDPAFIREWIKKFATQIPDPKKPDKIIWVKREIQSSPSEAGPMTAMRAVEATKKIFPGAEPASDVKPGVGEPSPHPKSSAVLFADYHDEMVRLNHLEILRTWWTKNAEEAEKKLKPEHWAMLVDLKNKMRTDFIKKARDANEKGGVK